MLEWLRMIASRINETDVTIERRIARIPRSGADTALARITTAANHSVLWFVIAAALASRRGVTRRAALRGVVAIGGASLLTNAVAKPLMPRRRPAADALPDFRTLPDPPTSSSFPSGHAASAAAFTTAVAMESPVAGMVIAPLAATVAYSRVHTGVHWTSDVVAGAALGGAVALATRRWWAVRPDVPARARPHADVEALPQGDGLVVAANKHAGDRSVDPADEINQALPKARIVALEAGDDLVERLTAEVDDSTKAVGVAGGDGSVAAVAAVAERHRLPLAVLPAGTLNHFARDIGVATFDDAAEAMRTGEAVSVDLATVRVDGAAPRPFVNTASIGGYPDMVRIRERWEHRLGKWVSAGLALIRVLAEARPLHVTMEGRRRAVWLLFVGNGPYHPRGMVPAWRPGLDTGLLDVRYLRADVRMSRTRFLVAALTGTLTRSRVYVQREIPRLTVDVHGEPVALATDGEVPASGTRFDFAVAEARLTVYRPKDPEITR
ncbi:bifunctional phosphatase PAP2/diacylglycerol kinase family protein [Actinophytocola sp.]|uniref:bifunctional phosphatase PAP2/diacylglycerol kinase family protein n=1 Tax=Actinophytocola sp. TaxID=1872138 RepID=UPI002D80B0D9|nr:phosphatase PAP2 family protein [Actinophytocola sp.]HET9140490.1 phosphatase PAP2 family protein [Actinophytocola sp.]